jgi:hypothetical protein
MMVVCLFAEDGFTSDRCCNGLLQKPNKEAQQAPKIERMTMENHVRPK